MIVRDSPEWLEEKDRLMRSDEKRRPPVHPGEMLLEEFMKPLGITPYRMAKQIGISQTALSDILYGRRGISPANALRLSRAWNNSPEFWISLQAGYDLQVAEAAMWDDLAKIEPFPRPDLD